jgi:hypothetical protein
MHGPFDVSALQSHRTVQQRYWVERNLTPQPATRLYDVSVIAFGAPSLFPPANMRVITMMKILQARRCTKSK